MDREDFLTSEKASSHEEIGEALRSGVFLYKMSNAIELKTLEERLKAVLLNEQEYRRWIEKLEKRKDDTSIVGTRSNEEQSSLEIQQLVGKIKESESKPLEENHRMMMMTIQLNLLATISMLEDNLQTILDTIFIRIGLELDWKLKRILRIS